jgi:hypothetical protein
LIFPDVLTIREIFRCGISIPVDIKQGISTIKPSDYWFYLLFSMRAELPMRVVWKMEDGPSSFMKFLPKYSGRKYLANEV